MKAMKVLTIAVSGMLAVGVIAGCKKNNGNNGAKAKCRINEASVAGGQDILITYDADGRVGLVDEGNGTIEKYIYKGDTLIIDETDSGRFSLRQVLAGNTAGLATYLRTEYDSPATIWTTTTYEYTGEELTRSTFIDFVGARSVTNFTWFDGNMVSASSPGNTTTYAYFTDKPYQDGDYFWFGQIFTGLPTIRNKNLVKSFSGNSFDYSFTADGKISAIEIGSAGSIGVVNYSYQCN
jgi:hypothetical protein